MTIVGLPFGIYYIQRLKELVMKLPDVDGHLVFGVKLKPSGLMVWWAQIVERGLVAAQGEDSTFHLAVQACIDDWTLKETSSRTR